MAKKVLILGPFVGSLEDEILSFRPHMRWIEKHTDADSVFYSSHFNRKFLYSHISNKRFIPVYTQFSRHEADQNGYTFKDVDARDFASLSKMVKDAVYDRVECQRKDIEQQTLPYVKNPSPISLYHKIFEPIKVPRVRRKGYIVFIPHVSMTYKEAKVVYDFLVASGVKFSVVGDLKCHLPQHNEVLSSGDYFETGYMKTIAALTNSPLVITPCSHWTMIANLQGSPVISWGDTVGPYRSGGAYNFGNDSAKVLFHDKDSNFNNVIKQIERTINAIS